MKKVDLLERIHQLEKRITLLESRSPFTWYTPITTTKVSLYPLSTTKSN